MKNSKKIALPGSHKAAHQGEATTAIDPNDTVEVTVRVRRKKSIDDMIKAGERVSRKSYEKDFGSSQKDIDAVEAFAHENHLSTVETSLSRRSVILNGRVADMETAFGVKLSCSSGANGKTYRVRDGHIYIPEKLKDIVEGVFGLDDRPAARPMFRPVNDRHGLFAPHAASPQSFTPNGLADIYGFTPGDGKGECIAIIELGGGYRTKDLTKYFKLVGVKKPKVKSISVDKGKNTPSTADSADGEVMLDIEVAGAVAPASTIAVYFCPNTDKGFLDAITKALHDNTNKPSVISISWGSAEVNWTEQSMNNFNEAFKTAAVLGVTITVAAGDAGSSDGVADGAVHVDFPASSPYVLACGGTSLTTQNGKVANEVVWNDSSTSAGGGGVSEFFPLPDYQKNANVPASINTRNVGRGVPDVAGVADPNTGYQVIVDGQEMVIGGTSAVAPLMAGLLARINQKNGKSAGFINPTLYKNPKLCRDIITGDNNTTASGTGYSAGPGWDACTGWGVLSGL